MDLNRNLVPLFVFLLHAVAMSVSAASTATRHLPSCYTADEQLSVSIGVAPEAGTLAYGVEEALPSGWTVGAINENGTWDDVQKKVKWVFLDGNSRTLSYQATPPGGESGTKMFSGTANFGGGDIAVGGTSAISNCAVECTYQLSSGTTNFTLAGGDGSVTVTVTSGGGCAWSAMKDAGWISFTSSTNGVDNGSVSFSVAANGGVGGRTGHIAVQGQSVTIAQAGTGGGGSTTTRSLPSCYTVGAGVGVSIGVTPDAGTLAYGVEDAPPTGWAVSSINESGTWDDVQKKVKWVFLDGNPRTLNYQATPPGGEIGTKTFSGTANFGGGDMAVEGTSAISQCEDECSYSVSSTTTNFHAGGGSGSVLVTIISGSLCEWNATKDVSWISFTSSTNGVENGAVSFAVAANSGGTGRTGHITVEGQTVTVSQEGQGGGGDGTGVRSLPTCYSAEMNVVVCIELNPPPGTFAWGAEDTPPMGWSIANIDEGGTWDDAQKKVKWVFLDGNARTLCYEATPPVGTIGNKAFSGIANFGESNIAIGGTSNISNCSVITPSSPTNLTVAGISQTEINLGWTDNAHNEDGFKIERSLNGNSGWTEIATLAANVISYKDIGLSCDSTRYYRVRAFNGGGESGYSNTGGGSTFGCAMPNDLYPHATNLVVDCDNVAGLICYVISELNLMNNDQSFLHGWIEFQASCKKCPSSVKWKLAATMEIEDLSLTGVPDHRINVYLSDDAILDAGDISLLKTPMTLGHAVKAYESGKLAKLKVRAPKGVDLSGKYLVLLLDCENSVSESDENNNTAVFGPLP